MHIISSLPVPCEKYHYDSENKRTAKISQQPEKNGVAQQQVNYFSGLEIHCHALRKKQGLKQQTIIVNGMRIIRWMQGKPANMPDNLLNYNVCDRSNSSTMVLDSTGSLISKEAYYPFGGTALWSTNNPHEANYKTQRYSGKIRDATGLIYYGYRYYIPWQMCWLNADPAGTVNGLNLRRMVANNPVTHQDSDGRMMSSSLRSFQTDMASLRRLPLDISAEGIGIYAAESMINDPNFTQHEDIIADPSTGRIPLYDGFNYIAALGFSPGKNTLTPNYHVKMAFMFADEINGQKRLNITGHSTEPQGIRQGLFSLNGQSYTAGDFQKYYLKKYEINYQNYDCIRMISCNSANGGFSSFSADLSSIMKKPVTGFVNKMYRRVPSWEPIGFLSQHFNIMQYPANQEVRLFDLAYWAFHSRLEGITRREGTLACYHPTTTVSLDQAAILPAPFNYQPRMFYTENGNRTMIDREWLNVNYDRN